jgi:hypothetical protein
MQSLDIITNLNELYKADSFVETITDFERVLDTVHLYAYDNWNKGELVHGPEISRHWVTCTFMWPHKAMPDPVGGKRLLDYNIHVSYKKDMLEAPVKVTKAEDLESGTQFAKVAKHPIWLVQIKMPKTIMQDVQRGAMEVEGETVDLEAIDSAYEQNLDLGGTKDDNTEQEI